jgi:glycine/D-amino acid oxidase-like deaminating enzyme
MHHMGAWEAMADRTYDVILVGGGAMGCATAYNLMKADSALRVAIVEMDPTYERASTPLSDGNIRIQFGLQENIQISQYGLEVLERFSDEMAVDDDRPDVAFRQQGNLFLVDEAGREDAEQAYALQKSLGCQIEWLEPEEISERYPLYHPAGCVGGTFGRQDGTMDPWALLTGYKNKAIALGADFVKGEVTELRKSGKRVAGVRLSSGDELSAGFVVNSAGAWAPRIARTVGIELPVQPVKRQVFVLETNARPDTILPFVASPSGLYWIHEQGGHFMCGKSLPDDPVGYEFDWDRRVFTEHLWPELVEFVPAFDRLKVARGWAGLYAVNTLDDNAILGEWPELEGLFLANGFSGHGLQQAPAVGRYIAELILGHPPALDLAIFSPQRILENRPVLEIGRSIV